MNQVTLAFFILVIACVPFSYCQNCKKSDVTTTDDNGKELGACKSHGLDRIFTYVENNNDSCCEAKSTKFTHLCINYSHCKGGGKGEQKGDGADGGGCTKSGKGNHCYN